MIMKIDDEELEWVVIRTFPLKEFDDKYELIKMKTTESKAFYAVRFKTKKTILLLWLHTRIEKKAIRQAEKLSQFINGFVIVTDENEY